MFDISSSVGSSSLSAKSSDLIPLFFNEDISLQKNEMGAFKKASYNSDGYYFRYGRWNHGSFGAPPWLSYYGLKRALEGYHFIFRGDSMIRQIFNRLVHHVRGYDTVIEHFFHLDATYTFNATHDLLVVDSDGFSNHHDQNHAHKEGGNSSFSVKNALFTASFIWDPSLDRRSTTGSDAPPIFPANVLLVVGLHYWHPFDVAEKKLLRFNSSQTIFVTTPNKYSDQEIVHKKAIEGRNEWIRQNSRMGKYIPLDEMARSGAFHKNREDGMHFQCSYLSIKDGWKGWIDPVAVLRNEIQFKAPASGDCRDMVNLNAVMLLAHFCTMNFTTATRASL